MRKFLCCLLSILLLLSLAACRFFPEESKPSGQTQPGPSGSNPAPSGGSTGSTDGSGGGTAPDDPWSQVPMTSISLPTVDDSITADNGTVIFRHTFQDVVLTTTDPAVTENVTLDLLRRIDANAGSLIGLINAAQNSYSADRENWSSFYFEVLYEPTRIDASVLSLHGAERSYAGAGVPSNSAVSVNYNLLTGRALTLADVLSDAEGAADALCKALLDTLAAQKEENSLFDDYADVISRRFRSDLQQDSSWYFSEAGLNFFYHPYDIAPHSSGTIYALIPYSDLSGILADDYFPAEQPSTDGKILSGWFEDVALDKFSHFSELILDSDSESAVLYTEGVLFDVELVQGRWDSKTNNFVPTSTVFASNCLAPGDAFVLQAPLSDTTPTLLLRYYAGGQECSFYVMKDILTGGILLQATS